MCVSELSQDKLLVLLGPQTGFLSHLVALREEELSQVGAILKTENKNNMIFKTSKLALQIKGFGVQTSLL